MALCIEGNVVVFLVHCDNQGKWASIWHFGDSVFVRLVDADDIILRDSIFGADGMNGYIYPGSYTHMTLPMKRIVTISLSSIL